jgi:hypothetical protein
VPVADLGRWWRQTVPSSDRLKPVTALRAEHQFGRSAVDGLWHPVLPSFRARAASVGGCSRRSLRRSGGGGCRSGAERGQTRARRGARLQDSRRFEPAREAACCRGDHDRPSGHLAEHPDAVAGPKYVLAVRDEGARHGPRPGPGDARDRARGGGNRRIVEPARRLRVVRPFRCLPGAGAVRGYKGTVGRYTQFPFGFALKKPSACVPMEVWLDGEAVPRRLVVPVGRSSC